MNQPREILLSRIGVVLILLLAVAAVSYRSLGARSIDGLDAAHTVMDGFYFHDLIQDHPGNPISYTLDYYRQYPALGFLFWPPLFPFLLSLGFFLGGLDIRIAHWCMAGCCLLVASMTYLIARRTLSRMLSLFGALLVVGTPIIGEQSSIIMRELPALAFGLTTVYAYLRFFDSPGWKRAVLLGVSGAAAMYTKQTILFLYPALALDVILSRRTMLNDRRLWAAALLMAILVAPLIAFTVGVSKVNVEQSMGNDPTLNMLGVGRWNAASLMFYPITLFRDVNPLVLIAAVLAIPYGIRHRDFFRANTLWFSWLLVWLLLFTWILAKEARHAIFWIPAWCMLAVFLVGEVIVRNPRMKYIQWVFVIPVLAGLWQTTQYRPSTYYGVESIVNKLIDPTREGNVMYFGKNRQVFVPYIRMRDTARRVYMLQGDDLTSGTNSPIQEICKDYRVRYVIGDREDADYKRVLPQLAQASDFSELDPVYIKPSWRGPENFRLFRYNGPLAAHMRKAPLNSKYVTAGVNDSVKQ